MLKLRVRSPGPRTVTVALSLGLLLAGAPGLANAAGFTRGFVDSVWESPGNASPPPGQWADDVYRSGGRVAEVEVDWSRYEPQAPGRLTNAGNPANPAYSDWSNLDAIVETLAVAHVQPMFLITDAPRWAEAKGRLRLDTEAYEPNDSALRAFSRALATRYDGHYPNPTKRRSSLPRVRYYQAWAEANLSIKLAPEWKEMHGSWQNIGASTYRGMLNAIYAGIKAAEPSDTVIFSGLEAYGDAPGGQRVQPVTFLENVLCLNAKLQKVCDKTAHFDVLASDPYDVGSPTTPAINADDASAPDMGKLTNVLQAALEARTALPDAAKPLWVTEFGYDSDPPNPAGLPLAEQARWLEQSLYVFWSEHVSTVLWYLIRDQPGRDYATTYDSGVYFYSGKTKPSYTAYQFPLVVAEHGSKSQAWGIAPAGGKVFVQELLAGHWQTVDSFHAAAGAVFDGLIATPTAKTSLYRAIEGSHRSLTWTY
jgi:hypothetical protein